MAEVLQNVAGKLAVSRRRDGDEPFAIDRRFHGHIDPHDQDRDDVDRHPDARKDIGHDISEELVDLLEDRIEELAAPLASFDRSDDPVDELVLLCQAGQLDLPFTHDSRQQADQLPEL